MGHDKAQKVFASCPLGDIIKQTVPANFHPHSYVLFTSKPCLHPRNLNHVPRSTDQQLGTSLLIT